MTNIEFQPFPFNNAIKKLSTIVKNLKLFVKYLPNLQLNHDLYLLNLGNISHQLLSMKEDIIMKQKGCYSKNK